MTKDEALKLALEALERGETELRWKAITVIRETLAQPEQEPVCAHGIEKTKCGFCHQPQRSWVGLTWDDLPETAVGDVGFMQGAKWAEAKLKEKNT